MNRANLATGSLHTEPSHLYVWPNAYAGWYNEADVLFTANDPGSEDGFAALAAGAATRRGTWR